MPALPDHWAVNEETNDEHPFKLATSPARGFLNSTFAETPGSLAREGRPRVMMHPLDAASLGVVEGDIVQMGNERGEVRLHAKLFDGVQRGVMVSEGIWPSEAFLDKRGINVLTNDEATAPFGGAAFHDCRVWVKRW
jgi:anaerobic selenocysteine-containing dehydrogenase